MDHLTQRIEERLHKERGTLFGQGGRAVALVYPSPYPVGMASLGFQSIYDALNRLPNLVAERAFLPDDGDSVAPPLLTYEGRRPAGDFPVIAFSVAYELEITGVFSCLQMMGLRPLRCERSAQDPVVVMGGPLTFSNPVPLSPFADLIVMGEAESVLEPLMDGLFSGAHKEEALRELARLPGFYVPSIHGEDGELPAMAQATPDRLPARSEIVTSDSALSDMFLIEPERGCSRACTFCVMRRSTNGGMRTVEPDRVLQAIPDWVPRVGFVGAAVTDHPRITDMVRAVVESGKGVGLSSLRADRLTPEFVNLLQKGGYRTLTVASDGASERLRIAMKKKIREKHLRRAAELAREAELPQLKVYMMLGVPDETDEDIDELVAFTLEQAELGKPRTRVALGVAPFVAKRNTPLDGLPFAGIKEVEGRMARVRKVLKGRAELRPTSARWAWVEYELAQGGAEAGRAAYGAWQAGGKYADWKRAFQAIEREQEEYRAKRREIVGGVIDMRTRRLPLTDEAS